MRSLPLFYTSFLIIFLSVQYGVQGDTCGGIIQANGGHFKFPSDKKSIDIDSTCVWLIQLLNYQTSLQFHFTLKQLAPGSTVSLYPQHDSTETILLPIRLDDTQIGTTVNLTGQVFVIIFSHENTYTSLGLEFEWKSTSSQLTTDVIVAANYMDNVDGSLQCNSFNLQLTQLTWVLSPPSPSQSQTLTLDIETIFGKCNLVNPCQCTYFALYEVRADGSLSEITRICGRSSQYQVGDVRPTVVAFVHVNATNFEVPPTDQVQITWSLTSLSTSPEISTTTEIPVEPETTTQSQPSKWQCGGVVPVKCENAFSTTIEYKTDEEYDNDERCVWTLRSTHASLQVRVDYQGFNDDGDGLVLYTSAYTPSNMREFKFTKTQTRASEDADQAFLSFSSDSSGTKLGFRVSLSCAGYPPSHRQSSVSFNSSSGSFEHSPLTMQGMSMVIHPLPKLDLEVFVDFADLPLYSDNIYVFTLRPYNFQPTLVLEDKITGYYPNGFENTTVSNYPRLLYYINDNAYPPKDGFKISWIHHE